MSNKINIIHIKYKKVVIELLKIREVSSLKGEVGKCATALFFFVFQFHILSICGVSFLVPLEVFLLLT